MAPVSGYPEETLLIGGAGTNTGAMKLMAEDFRKRRPRATIVVLPSIGTSGAIKAVAEDRIDIGLTSRALNPEERDAEIIEEPYGQTALIFGVPQSNPAEGLTLAEIEDIYARKRTAWPDGTPIRLILRPQKDTLSIYLAGISPGLKSASEKARSVPGVFVGMTDQDAAAQIEKTPGAFGVMSASLISSENRRIKALSVQGTAPTPSNVAAGKYPYVLTLFLIYKRDRCKGAVKDFVELVFSKTGRNRLYETNHVALPRATRK